MSKLRTQIYTTTICSVEVAPKKKRAKLENELAALTAHGVGRLKDGIELTREDLTNAIDDAEKSDHAELLVAFCKRVIRETPENIDSYLFT